MAKKKIDTKDLQNEKKREQVIELYRTRLTHLKRAQAFVKEDRMNLAVDSYIKYLGVLGLYFDTTEDKLSPSLFDPEKDMTELLLISHAYWDLAKAYDRSPTLQKECLRCLEQFMRFSIGFKYQHVNAQIVRKFNLKKQAHNPKAFEAAYHRIQISSKKCYIATECWGNDHLNTETLREFKLTLANSEVGKDFIDWYYNISPRLLFFLENKRLLKWCFKNFLAKPLLSVLVTILRPYVQHQKTHS